MADTLSKRRRSEVMSRVRACSNKSTELAMIEIFREHRITGWRRKQPVFGRPDFVFRQVRLAVFVDGCFWHCCPKHGRTPASNRPFWLRKLDRNVARDLLVNRTLRRSDWRVVRIWECDLVSRRIWCANRIRRLLATAE